MPEISKNRGQRDEQKGRLLASALEVLRRGPDYDLVDFHVGWLLDGVSDRVSDRIGRNSHFVELAQILSRDFLRAAFR